MSGAAHRASRTASWDRCPMRRAISALTLDAAGSSEPAAGANDRAARKDDGAPPEPITTPSDGRPARAD